MTSITKRQPEHSNFDAFVWAMFLLWASRPDKQSSEPDGSYFIGDCGSVPEKSWERPIGPYSPARRFGR